MPISKDHDSDFDHLIQEAAQAWLRENETAVTDHPNVETLIAYQEGSLDESDATTVRRHIEACEQCQQEIAALELFDRAEPEPGEEHTTDFEQAASWSAFRAQREKLEDKPRRAMYWPIALAAALLLAVIGLGSWVATILPTAGKTPYIVDLSPEGSTVLRQAAKPKLIRMPPTADTLILQLNLGDQTAFGGYKLALSDGDGLHIITRDEPSRDPQGRFGMMIPGGLITPGLYRVELQGVRGEEKEPVVIATYAFQIRDGD